MKRLNLQKWALILVMLGLSACSRLDLVVSFVPRYATNQLDDAFDLSSQRYKKIKETIASDINDNKKEFITSVIGEVDYLLVLTNKKDLAEADLKPVFDEIKVLQKKLINLFKPVFSEVILPLSHDEILNLKIYAGDKFEEADNRLVDKQKYYKYYTKIYERYMELLFDSTNDLQDNAFRTFLDENYDYFKFQNTVRKDFLKQFEVLSDKKNALLDYVMKYYAGDDEVKSDTYVKMQSTYYNNIIKLFSDIWKDSTEKQKNNFTKNLYSIRTELKNLIK